MPFLHRAVLPWTPLVLGVAMLGLPTAAAHRPPMSAPAAVPAAVALPNATLPAVTFVRRASGLDQAVAVTSAKDGSSRLFVSEKAGQIRVVHGGTVAARPFLDLSSRVRADGEGGLLSVAFHPDYLHHHELWVAYTDLAGDLRIDRFRARTAHAGHALLSSRVHLLDVPHPVFSNHYSGQLAFGTTGLLFVSTGDGGSAGDPDNHAQDRQPGGQDPAAARDRGTPGLRSRVLHPVRQPLRRAHSRAGRDLGQRGAQRLAVLRRPGHR
jgi:glucose/arabinose dehydrogenase